MDWGRIAGLFLLMFGFAAASVAAEKPTLADAAERRNRTLIRTLLDAGADVNAAQADGMENDKSTSFCWSPTQSTWRVPVWAPCAVIWPNAWI